MINKAKEICEKVKKIGGSGLIVGGYVRDTALGLPCKDIDIEVYSVEPRVLKEILKTCGTVDCVGESFKVYKVSWKEGQQRLEIDVSIPRIDKKIGEGHKGFEVVGNPYASYEDAARRRDFTINAIMFDPLTKVYVDPFNGYDDLNNGIIKAVDSIHFAEDPLRVLRALQFAGRFSFDIDHDTAELCRSINLSELPKERIWAEFAKLFSKSKFPMDALQNNYKELGIDKLIPSLGKINFGNTDADIGQYLALYSLKLDPETEFAVKTAFPLAGENESIVDAFIEEVGMVCEGSNFVNRVKGMASNLDVPFGFYEDKEFNTDADVRKISLIYPVKDLFYLSYMLDVLVAEYWKQKLEEVNVWDAPPTPILTGKHLIEMGMKPGPEMGALLKEIFGKQLDGFVTDLEQAKQLATISLKYSSQVSIV